MRTTILLISIAFAISGCGGNDASSGAKPAAQTASGPSALVVLSDAHVAPISRALTTYGTVEFSPEGARAVTADLEEVVTRLQVAVGQPVRKGEALLTLAPSAATRLQIESAGVNVKFARKDVERLVRLRTQGLATNTEVQAAEKNLASVAAQLSSLEQRAGAGGTTVLRAQAQGVVQAVNVTLGQLVSPGAALLTIGDSGRTRVRLGVEEDDLLQLQVGQTVEVQALNSSRMPVTTKLEKVFPQVNMKTRLAEAVVALPPKHGLLPGAFVSAQIVVEKHPYALLVPRSAVLYDKNKPHVFVDVQGHAKRLDVATGLEDSQSIEITQGLAAGDRVISSGNTQVSDGMAVRTQQKQ